MTLLSLPDTTQRRLVFYLAMEEWAASRFDIGEAFFLWRVPPTVIFGRNQDMEAEVNVSWCQEHGVQMYRRKSGGGCVYSDMGNVMISYITSGDNVQKVFEGYMQKLCSAIRSIGIPAEASGRNDLLVEGLKVSGNAFQLHGTRSIVHGTLLFDSDFEAMSKAITPSVVKVESKGVKSVRQRVGKLSDWFNGGIEEFIELVTGAFCSETYVLNGQEIKEIEDIEKSYLNPAFLYGRAVHQVRRRRFEGVGEIAITSDLKFSGDYFLIKEGLEDEISRRLNCESSAINPFSMSREALSASLRGLDPSEFICGLSLEMLISLLVS